MLKILYAGMFAIVSVSAQAITVDGTITPGEYAGAFVTQVPYTPGVPTDFSTINQGSELAAYTAYFASDAKNLYVGLISNPAGVGNDQYDSAAGLLSANLYFDLDPQNHNGSDLGFEVTNNRGFVAGLPGFFGPLTSYGFAYASTVGTTYANGAAPNQIEFSIPFAFLVDNPLGLAIPAVTAGSQIQFRTSQTFGFSPVNGDGQPADTTPRFGTFTVPVATPEAATMALFGGGLGLLIARRRR